MANSITMLITSYPLLYLSTKAELSSNEVDALSSVAEAPDTSVDDGDLDSASDDGEVGVMTEIPFEPSVII